MTPGNESDPVPARKMDDATRLRLLEDALRDRDWMRVMDVVEDMGGNWRIHSETPTTALPEEGAS